MVRDRHAGSGQGMNWIRKPKRLAIYMRDGLACVYCGEGIEDGAKLTLDHLVPHSHGGSNDESNLVTACHRCNSKRGNRTVEEFAAGVAAYVNHGVQVQDILGFIAETTQRKLDTKTAQAMIERRGGFTQALYGE